MGRLRQHGPKSSSDPGKPASEATSRLATSLLPEALVAVMPRGQLQRGGVSVTPKSRPPAGLRSLGCLLRGRTGRRTFGLGAQRVLGPGEGRSTPARASQGAPGRLAGLPYGSVLPRALAVASSRCSRCPVPSEGPGRPPAAGSTCFSGPVPGGYASPPPQLPSRTQFPQVASLARALLPGICILGALHAFHVETSGSAVRGDAGASVGGPWGAHVRTSAVPLRLHGDGCLSLPWSPLYVALLMAAGMRPGFPLLFLKALDTLDSW